MIDLDTTIRFSVFQGVSFAISMSLFFYMATVFFRWFFKGLFGFQKRGG